MKRVTLLDGALGSNLMHHNNNEGVHGCNFTHPDLVYKLHCAYIENGSEIICSNTFSANSLVINEHSEFTTPQAVSAGVEIALSAAQKYNDIRVALDVGPLTELLEPYGDLEEEQCKKLYEEIITAGVKSGAQLIFFETFIDLEMLKIAVNCALKLAPNLPIYCSMSFLPVGKTFMGQSVQDMVQSLEPLGVSAIGLNCSMEPLQSLPVAKMFREFTDLPLIFKPNAGQPQATLDGFIYEEPQIFTKEVLPIEELGGNLLIGGCCGTTPQHIKDLKNALRHL